MNDNDKSSRINKFEKRRKTTKSITILLLLGGVLIIVLLFMWIFGGSDNDSKEPDEASTEIQRDENDSVDKKSVEEDEEETDKEKSEEDEDEDKEKEEEDEVKTEEVESSDNNVTKAYTGDWKAVGTEQSGPHTTNYDDGSQDRIEMEKAIQSATGLGDMTPLWIGNDGDQKVVATVSSTDNSDIYRVYLSWIDEEGWQPTKVEELKESDV